VTVQHGCAVVMPMGRVDDDERRQIIAVLAQQDAPTFELVLSLNTDDTDHRQRLDELLAELADDRVRVVPSHDRRGASHARNVGARSCVVPIIAFCDSDDVAEPNWLAGLLAGLGDHAAVGGALREDLLRDERQASWRPPATPDSLPTFLGAPYIVSASMAITREAFEAIDGFDESLTRCEDIAISFSLLAAGRSLGFAADSVMHYRQRPGFRAMLKQHYLYGRGMSEVLLRYGVPAADGVHHPKGLSLLRPNAQPGDGQCSIVGVVRRAAIAAGRVVGIVSERVRSRRGGALQSAARG